MTIKDSALREYATLLASNGFAIYEPAGVWNHFFYSRVVDGRELFGYVQREMVGSGYSHSMPIKPSREHGNQLAMPDVDELTVENAEKVASPRNRNDWVGTHENYRPDSLDRMYTRWP